MTPFPYDEAWHEHDSPPSSPPTLRQHITPLVETPQALAEAVAADGFDAHRHAVADVVADARRVGICELLACVSRSIRRSRRWRANGPSARLVAAYTRRSMRQRATARRGHPPTSERFTVAA